jgi:signal transduction histidine kinase/ActR/RegA family two-component response regulator
MGETARQEKEPALLAAALDAADSAVLVFEAGQGVVLFNPAVVALLGAPPVGPDGLPEWEQACGFHSDDPSSRRPRQRTPLEDLPWNRCRRGEVVEREHYFLRNAQHRAGAWVQVSATRAAGRVLISARDISTRRRAELALKSARRMTRVLFDESRAPIVRTTVDGKILAANKAFARMVGFANPMEVRAFHVGDFIMDAARDAVIAELVRKGSLLEQPFQFQKRDGTSGTATANLQMVEPAPGESEWSIVITMVDLSGHRQSEAARVNLETQFHAFMRHFPGVAFIKDRSGKYLYLSESLKALGEDAVHAVGHTEADAWPQQAVRATEELPVGDGVHQWTVYKFPIPDETGEPQWIGGVGVDDTDRLKLESRLQEAERMEAIGRLAGGVAHDFNNLLTVIAGYGQMLNDAMSRRVPHDQLQIYVDELMAATGRATSLTDQLLAFGRRQKVRMQRLNLNEQVKSAASLLSRVIGEHIDMEVDTCAEDCFIRADPGQVGQVIMNLAVNARDAMPGGGRLIIGTGLTEAPPDGMAPGKFVVLRVSDTGIGMDSVTQLRIFEPFFTSKPKGKGTGLGLSTVYGIVKQMGGEIVVASEPGAGSVFEIYFKESPASEAPAAVPNVGAAVDRKTVHGHETILVVEDDENVRALVKAMLDRFGFKTLTAEGGKDAIRVFQERGAEVQLLLTDVIMPNMSGRELAMRLQRIAPGLKVLYMSGYTADEVSSKGVSGRLNILRKPFDADTLAQRVRDVLSQSAARG